MRPHRRRTYLGDPDATAWATAVFVAGAQISQRQRNLTAQLVRGLKATGVWSSLDRLFLFASENSTQALTCLVSRQTATAVNSPTFAPNSGYTGDGATSYINTNFNLLSSGTNYTQNSAHYGICRRTVAAGANADGCFNASSIGDVADMGAGVGAASAWVNSVGGPSYTVSANGLGTIISSRTASNLTTPYYENVAGAGNSTASSALPSLNFFVGACNNNAGSLYRPHNSRIAWVSLGGALTAVQASALYTAMSSYVTAKGA